MTSPLLVFSDDWGRHPSSCQHLIRQLLDRRPVTWVDTIGTRTPKFDLVTAKRVAGKLKGWIRPKKSGSDIENRPANLTVLSPKMWPYFRNRFDRRLNRALLLRQLKSAIVAMPELPTVVTTLPIIADLIGKLPAAKWVYYCVDDFSQWPGLDQAVMDRMERELVAKVDTVIAVSETLQARLKGMGRESHLLTHGVDVDFWRASHVSGGSSNKMKILFWGVIDRRMDVEFLRQLSNDLSEGEILLVGPENEPDPELYRLPRVKRLPAVPFEKLPKLAAEVAVLVMPYADLPVTRAMQPLKLKEYLATGKPVVVRDLPANRAWGDALDLASTPTEFSKLVRERMMTGLSVEQASARRRLGDESWASKARQFEEWIDRGT